MSLYFALLTVENNKNKKSVKFQGDMLNFCDFIQDFVFTTNHHLKPPCDHVHTQGFFSIPLVSGYWRENKWRVIFHFAVDMIIYHSIKRTPGESLLISSLSDESWRSETVSKWRGLSSESDAFLVEPK